MCRTFDDVPEGDHAKKGRSTGRVAQQPPSIALRGKAPCAWRSSPAARWWIAILSGRRERIGHFFHVDNRFWGRTAWIAGLTEYGWNSELQDVVGIMAGRTKGANWQLVLLNFLYLCENECLKVEIERYVSKSYV